MKLAMNKHAVKRAKDKSHEGEQGFTLMETAIAMVVMMVVGLGAASLFVYALGTNSSARDRELSMAVAQAQLERLRNTAFEDLDATLTATGGGQKYERSAGRQYLVRTTIAETVSGNATHKTITIQVTPRNDDSQGQTAIQRVFGGVTLVTQRSTNVLGAYRTF